MATNSEVKILGRKGAEQLVAEVKNLVNNSATSALDDAKAYTDTKISSLNTGNLDMNLITVEDIDAICGATIQMASEVTF